MQMLVRTVTAAAGIDVRYRRGDVEAPIRVIPKEITVRTDSIDGGFVETTFRRYIIEKAKLLFDPEDPNSSFLPAVGDIVVEPNGRTYRVCIFQGETAWNDHDLSDINIQFHAVEILSQGNVDKTNAGKAGTDEVEANGKPSGEGFFLP